MRYKFEYHNIEEKKTIINENANKLLIEEQNITEGNFLIFEDSTAISSEIEIVRSDITDIAETTATALEDTTTIAQTTASLVEDNTDTAETLAQALFEIENLKAEITALKGV